MFVAPGQVEIAIVGAGCRLPGAKNRIEFNNLISSGVSAVASGPQGRWNVDKFLHPNPSMPGFSYTFAGGYLEDIFDFDPVVFGMSPREAMEADPQQRLLLETVYEALEDAWMPRSSLRGKDVGVYVGASSLDHGSIMAADPAAIDRYFMTGNTLSVISNRLSHNYDWRGPSFTVDTACSSSMVAFVQAISDLAAGRVETAIVAGVNLLLNPMSFVGFSRASMLSPTGLCRPFSKGADGYVRGEGAVAFVLRRADAVVPGSARAWVLAGGMNNDGRTSGIALPSAEGQARLLDEIYGGADISPDKLAFVEAHGTGTQVGDAVEASALGAALGRKRSSPLPVGSVKSNLGHLEPASGVVGILKAIHALETRRLPRSLHLDELNPYIDFNDIGITPAVQAIDLAREGQVFCGVSSFGFGGTNAHIVLRSAETVAKPVAGIHEQSPYLVLSAATREALLENAALHADVVAKTGAPDTVALALNSARDRLPHRLVVPSGDAHGVAEALRAFAEGRKEARVIEGTALPAPKICFAVSGNGTLTVDLTRAAFTHNETFRAKFLEVAEIFRAQTGDNLEHDLFAEDYEERKSSASFLQPLMFAFHYAIAGTYIAMGVRPDLILGHSFGEISAACIAGAITLEDAATIIAVRAACQERMRGLGGMAVFSAGVDEVAALIETVDTASLEIAAENGPSSTTVTGTFADVKTMIAAGRRKRIAGRMLDLQYPFHSKLLDELEPELLKGLSSIQPRQPHTPFISTVAGEAVGDRLLDAGYWWENFRRPVAFRQAVETAHSLGANLFIEISQRPILVTAIGQTLSALGSDARVITSLQAESGEELHDPMAGGIARAVANGAATSGDAARLAFVDRSIALPHYPWQKRTFHFEETPQHLDIFGSGRSHPLIGERLFKGSQEWRVSLDSTLVPYLADHVVDGEVVVPGSAIAEMMLAVGRVINEATPLSVEDLDILQAMTLPSDNLREVCIRHMPATGVVEVLSRLQRNSGDWTLNARGRLTPASDILPWSLPAAEHFSPVDVDGVYRKATEVGMYYGPAFRRLKSILRHHWTIRLELEPVAVDAASTRPAHVLHPASMDACFHALFHELENDNTTGRRSYLPIRFGKITVLQAHAGIASAILKIDTKTDQWLSVSATLFDCEGNTVARLEKVLLRSVVLSQGDEPAHLLGTELWRDEDVEVEPEWLTSHMRASQVTSCEDALALLNAHMCSVAYDALRPLCDTKRRVDLREAVARSALAPEAVTYAETLLTNLTGAGIAECRDDGSWILPARSGLPEAERILATFIADYPSAASEIMLAAGTMGGTSEYLATGKPLVHREAVVKRFASDTLLLKPATDALNALLNALIDRADPVRPRVVISASHAEGLLSALVPLATSHRIRLAIAGRNHAEARHLAIQLPENCPVQLVDLSDGLSLPRAGSFDLVLSSLSVRQTNIDEVAEKLGGMLTAKGVFLVVGIQPSSLLDFYFGAQPHWFTSKQGSHASVERPPSAEEVINGMARSGIHHIEKLTTDISKCFIIGGRRGKGDAKAVPAVKLLHRENCRVAPLLRDGLAISAGVPEQDQRDTVCLLVPGQANEQGELPLLIELAMDAASQGDGRLWFVTSAAFGEDVRPASEAIWSFCRVLTNEYPQRDIRLLDYSPTIEAAEISARIGAVLADHRNEREVHLDAKDRFAVRIVPLQQQSAGTPQALTLTLPPGRGIADLSWRPSNRREPDQGQIEVEVEATGLNFRDVMLAMGLLYDDVLDGGVAGAVLGFECAGRVTSVGKGVTGLSIGDHVCGVASEAFSTHVTAPGSNFIKIPEGLDPQKAATIPVAFLTAWYGLVEMARLKAGETVLIHGAAGGVGLAALQIAKARGAKVVATVSTPDKRALVQLLGADAVYDSRTTDFQEYVNNRHGGVDVVLNSLAGDAMRASLKCLKPFGRFVELGKRDYIGNTEIALRPFRRNLSYFGVDVDQLFSDHPKVAARGLSYILKGFQSGRFIPIPHTVFRGEFAAEAMRLMQGAGHIGKIVICPPRIEAPGDDRTAIPGPFKPEEGTQLIVGGTGGFGFATALWLADRGAKHIVLASRSGRLGEEEAAQLGQFTACGTTLTVLPLDVSNAVDVEALVLRVSQTIGPISGVYHAAAVLHDALAANLLPEQISSVLLPKVEGTFNLDRATRSQPVRDFVVFSSEASLVGNPGQSAYAAANAFMHGVVRQRRKAGLPGLAVGWGAISDVGILARDASVARKLERATGAQGLRATEAHAMLGDLLARQSTLTDPVVYFGRMRFESVARDLPVVQSPTFGLLFRSDGEMEAGIESDLLALLATKPQDEAMSILTGVITAEVAEILRVSPGDIDIHQPLGSLGLDSLMALELRMSLESKFGLELPLMAITSVQNLKDLASRVLEILHASVTNVDTESDGLQDALYHMHVGSRDDTSEVVETIY
ncbi:type I polyketide synthase [Rhizobium sp. FY34]|uniref:type I polyketide synthase n=1 Tax=Rhizobium sp. FY34 TaxID=2562309 RepID=UPI0010BFC942|nr:type I polyketide synthase [Rhizobium sp. FY34]